MRMQSGINILPDFMSSTFLSRTKQDEKLRKRHANQIISYLKNRNRPVSISELTEELNLDVFQTKGILESMKKEKIVSLD